MVFSPSPFFFLRGVGKGLVRFWIGKGDFNKRYDVNEDPNQSFLFCLKALTLFF